MVIRIEDVGDVAVVIEEASEVLGGRFLMVTQPVPPETDVATPKMRVGETSRNVISVSTPVVESSKV